MGIGFVEVILRVIKVVGLIFGDINFFELNEVFVLQLFVVICEIGLNQDIVNVNGGVIVLGYLFGCIGVKLIVQIINELCKCN